MLSAIKPVHLAALGLLLTSVAAQIATLPDWAACRRPVFVAALLASIGSTLIALFSDKPRDPEALTRRNDPTPRLPIWLLPIMLATAVGLSGCASAGGARHVATVSSVSAHSVLSAVQDTELLLVCGRPSAPAAPLCVPEAKHKELSGKLAQAFGYDAQAARVIRAMPAGSPQPAEVANLLAQIAVLVNQIIADLPKDAPQTSALVANLQEVK